jgi:phosphoribosylformylglycinamidine (FGAM) synthase-like enzyme
MPLNNPPSSTWDQPETALILVQTAMWKIMALAISNAILKASWMLMIPHHVDGQRLRPLALP